MAVDRNKIRMLDGDKPAITAYPAGVNNPAVGNGIDFDLAGDIAVFNISAGVITGEFFRLNRRTLRSDIYSKRFFSKSLKKIINRKDVFESWSNGDGWTGIGN